MSRSYKKAIIKDKPRNSKKSSDYWRRTRSRINDVVRQLKYDPTLEIPNEKTIVNDYDYSDYKFDYEYDLNSVNFPIEKMLEKREKLRRK